MTRNKARLIAVSGALMAGALLLAGCSDSNDDASHEGMGSSSSASSSDSPSGESTGFNDADVAFAQEMIVHHQGAITMAQLADSRAEDSRVLDLANRIESAQQPEIDTMTGWLEDWGQPLSEEAKSSEDMGGMDHGDTDMGDSGMDMDMAPLEAASGAEFDRMFLEMMVEHHRGAVEMAETEIADGENADAVQMARQIVTDQNAEIQEMEALLSELGS